jgi:molybdate-binding protein/DNA-binding transcriptional regulator YhcF (GntR family)
MDIVDSYLYLQIAETIRRRIASGELEPGDNLPPVRIMAQDWNCTPGTVNHAYQTLTQEGLVVGQRGKGTMVAQSPAQSQNPTWEWAKLVNRAERFLLESLSAGHNVVETETALSVAAMRCQDLRLSEGPPVEELEPAGRGSLRFAGSHDLVVDLMARMLRENTPDVQLSIEYTGSLGGLMALAKNEADLTGTHLWDVSTDTYNIPFIKRIMPGKRLMLLTVVHRQLGLILPTGNPQTIQGLRDLTRPGVRFINRQSGSGSRVWLDAKLKRLRINAGSIEGYTVEETTHIGLADAIAHHEATAGLGIFAAASSFGLDFIPLTTEQYDLVLPDHIWQLPEAQMLVEVLRSSRFKEAVSTLGGYDLAATGQETWVA